jgi:hypothetical protein
MRHQEADNNINTDAENKLAVEQIISKCKENIDTCEERPPQYLE